METWKVSEMTYKVLVACEESQTVCKAFRAKMDDISKQRMQA